MSSETKHSRILKDRKRNEYAELALDRRQRGGRKPETLQTFWQKRLQQWLDFANLLPVDADDSLRMGRISAAESDTLHREFVKQFASRPKDGSSDGLRFFAQRLSPRNRRLEELFVFVRNAMVHCLKWARFEVMLLLPNEQELFSSDPTAFWASEFYDPIDFSVPYVMTARIGRITSEPYMYVNAFREVIEGLEITRIRRCPIADCGKFFYAVRFNTGACNEHLARVRVQRGRDPELRQQYEETRQINRRVHTGMPLDQARAEVERKRRKRRTVQ
jgi:hypothetical protein